MDIKNYVIFFGILFIGFLCLYKYEPKIEISSINISKIENSLFSYINDERGVDLVWDDCLKEIAREKSKDMFNRDYFSHKDPETSIIETWEKIEKNCGNYKLAGENLVKDFKGDPLVAHKALMNSESHKDNIIDSNYYYIGIGCYDNICTQLFVTYID
jgi:uncharacterized protein YkwD